MQLKLKAKSENPDMDWTIPLKSQQADFIVRLKSDLTNLLKSQIRGHHSEIITISGQRLKQIRTLCRKLVLQSEQNLPVREVLMGHLQEKLAEEVILNCLDGLITPVDTEAKQRGETNRSFTLKINENIGIQVKLGIGNIDALQWCITSEDVQANAVVVLVLIPEDLTEDPAEANLILAGFLPTNKINLRNDIVYIGIKDLLYAGGLRTYIESFSSTSENKKWLRPLTGLLSFSYPVAISADGQILASCSFDGKIQIWRLGNQENPDFKLEDSPLKTFSGNSWSFANVSFNPEGRSIPSNPNDGPLQPWYIDKGKLINSLTAHTSGVSSVAISADGELLVSGGYDGTIKIWYANNGTLRKILPGHSETVRLIAISPNSQIIASSTDKTIKVWHIDTSSLLHNLSGQAGAVLAIAISPDGQTLASGGYQGDVKLWDLTTGELKHSFYGHAGTVRSIVISPDGQTLATSSTEKTIKLWDLNTGELQNTLTGKADPLISLGITPESKLMNLSLFRYSHPGWLEFSESSES